jgi:hypothetical protein
MKSTLLVVTAASLAGNVGLAASTAPAQPPVSASPGENRSSIANNPSPPATGELVKLRPTDNVSDLIANMRRAGFPPTIIRAVANHYVMEAMSPKNPLRDRPFWQRHTQSKEVIAEMLAYSSERQKMLESLIGDDAKPAAMLDEATRRARFGNMSADKINAISQIEKDYMDVRSQAYASRTGSGGSDLAQQHALLEKEKWADLAAVLTPQELAEYEMRNSRSASELMNNLRNVDVAEHEYASLYRLQKNLDENHSLRGPTTPDQLAARREAQVEMNQQVRTMLGDERYYRYLEGADPSFSGIRNFASRHSALTQTAVIQLYEIQSEAHATIFSNRLNPADRSRLIAGFNERLDATLGPELAALYRKEGPGRMFTISPGGVNQAINLGTGR